MMISGAGAFKSCLIRRARTSRRRKMMTELKPCPFCGGEANYQGFELNNYCVYCRKCGTSTRKYYASKDEARDAWNRRVNDGKAAD